MVPSIHNHTQAHQNKKSRIVAITSGKGGVGKTTLSINLARILTELQKRVLLIDADLGLANVDIHLGLQSQYTLQDVIGGRKKFQDIALVVSNGFRVIPASSGVQNLTDLNPEERDFLIGVFQKGAESTDIVLLDIGAGIGANAVKFSQASDEVLVITHPEPAAITDAYAMMKILWTGAPDKKISFIMNMVQVETEAERMAQNLKSVCRQFLNHDPDCVGFLPVESKMRTALVKRKVFVELYPDSLYAQKLKEAAFKFFFHKSFGPIARGFSGFISKLMKKMAGSGIDIPSGSA